MISKEFKKTVSISPYHHILSSFQSVTKTTIISIWRDMREGGNSQDGKVKRDAFKRILNTHFENIKDSLVEDLFDRKYQHSLSI
mgnify:FL=1